MSLMGCCHERELVASDAGVAGVAKAPRIGLYVGDELRDRGRRDPGIDNQHEGEISDPRHSRELAHRVVVNALEQIGLAEWVLTVVMNTVYPSGAARATAPAAIAPFAPGLKSMTTGCLSALLSSSPTMRAVESIPLPAANGTTSVIGRLG